MLFPLSEIFLSSVLETLYLSVPVRFVLSEGLIFLGKSPHPCTPRAVCTLDDLPLCVRARARPVFPTPSSARAYRFLGIFGLMSFDPNIRPRPLPYPPPEKPTMLLAAVDQCIFPANWEM